MSSGDQGDTIPAFPALPENFPFADASLVTSTKNNMRSEHHRRPSLVKKNNFTWLSVFKELFVSRTVFYFADDDDKLPEDMSISWSSSDEDSDISTVPGLDEWGYTFDHDPSEEDTFCVETVLRRTPSTDSDSSGEEEESVLVTFSTLE